MLTNKNYLALKINSNKNKWKNIIIIFSILIMIASAIIFYYLKK